MKKIEMNICNRRGRPAAAPNQARLLINPDIQCPRCGGPQILSKKAIIVDQDTGLEFYYEIAAEGENHTCPLCRYVQ